MMRIVLESEYFLPEMAVLFDAAVQVFESGAKKHGGLNFLDENGSKCAKDDMYASVFRHVAKVYRGERIDVDSGLDHRAHIICRLLIDYVRDSKNLVHPKDL